MSERLEGAMFRRSPAGAAALTLLALGLGGWGVINSPIFQVRRIDVIGAYGASLGHVRELAGVRPGDKLLRLSLDAVAARIERSPWVRDAAVERDLPETLVIRVVERTPTGWVADPEGSMLVARDGTALDRMPGPPADLPSLGSTSNVLVEGQRIPDTAPLRVAASMGGRLLERLEGIVVDGAETVLLLRGGGTVRYGPPIALEAKNEALGSMLEWSRREAIEVEQIDLRVPSAPTLLPHRSPVP